MKDDITELIVDLEEYTLNLVRLNREFNPEQVYWMQRGVLNAVGIIKDKF